jgi:desulfoferrodoxin-like iron-binding protein
MEKRSSGRVPSNLKIKLRLEDDINTGTLVNFSRSGMLINTKLCFPLKSTFDILLPAGDEILKVPVKVSRLLKKDNIYNGIGVELLDTSRKYLEFLNTQSRDLNIKGKRTKTFVCSVCGHITFEQAPINCPFCCGPIDNFSDNSGEVNIPEDFQSLTDFEKKHFPMINIAKADTSTLDARHIHVHVKVGEIQHEMEVDEHIKFIDFYFNDLSLHKKCIARVNLNCHIINPETVLSFHDTTSGILTVISNCSAHGNWLAEANI